MRDDLDIPMPIGGPSYRVSRRSQGLDPNTKRLALVAGGIGGALLLLVGVWSATGHHRGGVPLILAAPGPVRVKPDKPGGLEVFGGDDSLLSGGADTKESMAAPPENPDPQGLRAQEARPQVSPSAVPPSSPASVPAATPSMPLATPTPLAAAPDQKPAPAAVRASPVAKPGPTSAPVETGGMQVQLAALTSEQGAMAEWARISHRMPELFGGHRPAITRTERDGKTWFRLRTGGFTDVAQATAFCQRVREKGGGCSIASF